jgi:hypothetical protein
MNRLNVLVHRLGGAPHARLIGGVFAPALFGLTNQRRCGGVWSDAPVKEAVCQWTVTRR